MNKIYKLKYSRTRNQVVVCSELETSADHSVDKTSTLGKILKTSLKTSMLTLGLITAVPALAQISQLSNLDNQFRAGLQVSAGQLVDVTVNQEHTKFVTKGNTVLNWNKFNVGSRELVEFIQDNKNSAVLHRVLGQNATSILGTLRSNGQVFVVNPSGIVVGKNATIDTNGLVLSSLELTNADFKAHKELGASLKFKSDKAKAAAQVLNQGVITVKDGSLALIGGQAVNKGVLQAKNGTVYLLAGHSIEIADLNNPHVSYKVTADSKAVNLGAIFAQKASLVGHKVAHGQTQAASFADILGASDQSASQASIVAGQVLLHGGSLSDVAQSTTQTNKQVAGARDALVVVGGKIKAQIPTTAAAVTTTKSASSSSLAEAATDSVQANGGRIDILGDIVVAEASADISAAGTGANSRGGVVYLGGDKTGAGELKLAEKTTVKHGAVVSVAAEGDAGAVYVWGKAANVNGSFLANSSANGKGGFVETSGKSVNVGKEFTADVSGAQAGEWLLDPEYLFILNGSAGQSPDSKLPSAFPTGLEGVSADGQSLNVAGRTITIAEAKAGAKTALNPGTGNEYTVPTGTGLSYIYDSTINSFFFQDPNRPQVAKTLTLQASKLTYAYKARVAGLNAALSEFESVEALTRGTASAYQKLLGRTQNHLATLKFSTQGTEGAALVLDDSRFLKFGNFLTLESANTNKFAAVLFNNTLVDSKNVDINAFNVHSQNGYFISGGLADASVALTQTHFNITADTKLSLLGHTFVSVNRGQINLTAGQIEAVGVVGNAKKSTIEVLGTELERGANYFDGHLNITATNGYAGFKNFDLRANKGVATIKVEKAADDQSPALLDFNYTVASGYAAEVSVPQGVALFTRSSGLVAKNPNYNYVPATAAGTSGADTVVGPAATEEAALRTKILNSPHGGQISSGAVQVSALGIYGDSSEQGVTPADLLQDSAIGPFLEKYFSASQREQMLAKPPEEIYRDINQQRKNLESAFDEASTKQVRWREVGEVIGGQSRTRASLVSTFYNYQSGASDYTTGRTELFDDSSMDETTFKANLEKLLTGTYTGTTTQLGSWLNTNLKTDKANVDRTNAAFAEYSIAKTAVEGLPIPQRIKFAADTIVNLSASEEIYLGASPISVDAGRNLTISNQQQDTAYSNTGIFAPFTKVISPRITLVGYEITDSEQNGYVEIIAGADTSNTLTFKKKQETGIDLTNNQITSCYINLDAGTGNLNLAHARSNSGYDASGIIQERECGHLSPRPTSVQAYLPNFDFDKYDRATSWDALPEEFKALTGEYKGVKFGDSSVFDAAGFQNNIQLLGQKRFTRLQQLGLLPTTASTPEALTAARTSVKLKGNQVNLSGRTPVEVNKITIEATEAFTFDGGNADAPKPAPYYEATTLTGAKNRTNTGYLRADTLTVNTPKVTFENNLSVEVANHNLGNSELTVKGTLFTVWNATLAQTKKVTFEKSTVIAPKGFAATGDQAVSVSDTDIFAPEIRLDTTGAVSVTGNSTFDVGSPYVNGNPQTSEGYVGNAREGRNRDDYFNFEKNRHHAILDFLVYRCIEGGTTACNSFYTAPVASSDENHKFSVVRNYPPVSDFAYKAADTSNPAEYLITRFALYPALLNLRTRPVGDLTITKVGTWTSILPDAKQGQITVKGGSVNIASADNFKPTFKAIEEALPVIDFSNQVAAQPTYTFDPENKREGSVDLQATTGDLTVDGADIKASHVNVTADPGNVTLNNARVNATVGNVKVHAAGTVSATGSELVSPNGNVLVDGSSVTLDNTLALAPKGDVILKATNGDLVLTSSQALGGTGVSLQATGPDSKGNVKLTDSQVAGPVVQVKATGDVEVKGDTLVTTKKEEAANITLKNNFNTFPDGTKPFAADDATWSFAKDGDGNDPTSRGYAQVPSDPKDPNSAPRDLTEGEVYLQSTGGDIKTEAKNGKGPVLDASKNLTVSATGADSDVALKDATLKSNTQIDVFANNNVTLDNTSAVAPQVNIEAKTGNIDLTNGAKAESTTGNTSVKASQGHVNVTEGAKVLSPNGNTTVEAKLGVKVDGQGSEISAGGKTDVHLTDDAPADAKIQVNNGGLITGGTNADVVANLTQGEPVVSVHAPNGNVEVNGGTIKAERGDTEVKADTGRVDVTNGGKIQAPNGNTTVEAAKGVKVDGTDSEISAGGKTDVHLNDHADENSNIDVTNGGTIKGGTNPAVDLGDKPAVSVHNPTGSVNVDGGHITAENGDAEVKADQGYVNVTNGGTITAPNGNTTVEAAKGVKVDGTGSEISAGGKTDVHLNSNATDDSKIEVNDGGLITGGTKATVVATLPAGQPVVTVTTPKGDVSVSGGTIKSEAGDVEVKADTGRVDVTNGGKIQAPNGNTTVEAAKGVKVDGTGSEISAGGKTDVHLNANATADSNIDVSNGGTIKGGTNSDVTIPDGQPAVSVHNPTGSVNVDGGHITAENGDAEVKADHGYVNVTNGGTITAPNGNTTVEAAKGIKVDGTDKDGNPSKISSGGKTDVSLNENATDGAKIEVTNKGEITGGTNANLPGDKGVTVTNDHGDVLVNGGKIVSENGDTTVDAKGRVDVLNGGVIDAPNGNTTVTSDTGIKVEGTDKDGNPSKISSGGKTNVSLGDNAPGDAKIEVSNKGEITGGTNESLTGDKGVNVTNPKGDILVNGGKIVSENGDTNVDAKGFVNVTNGGVIDAPNGNTTVTSGAGINVDGTDKDGNPSKISSGGKTDVSLKPDAPEGSSINVTNGGQINGGTNPNLDGDKGVNVTNPVGDININGGQVNADNGDVNIKSEGYTNVTNGGKVSAPNGNVTIEAKDGANIDGEGTKVTSGGLTTITVPPGGKPGAGINITGGSTVEGGTNTDLPGEKGVKLDNQNESGDINVDGSTVSAKNGNVTGTAPNGHINVTGGSTVEAPNGDVTLDAGKGVNIEDSHVEAGDKLTVRTNEGEINVKGSELLGGTKENSNREQGVLIDNPHGKVNLDDSKVHTHHGDVVINADTLATNNTDIRTGVDHNGQPGSKGDILINVENKLTMENTSLVVEKEGDVKIVNKNKDGNEDATVITNSTITVPKQNVDPENIFDENGNLIDPDSINEVVIRTENNGTQVVKSTVVEGTVVDISSSGDGAIDLDKISASGRVVIESERGNLSLTNATSVDAPIVIINAGLGDRDANNPYNTSNPRPNRNPNAQLEISADACVVQEGLEVHTGSGKGITYTRDSSCDTGLPFGFNQKDPSLEGLTDEPELLHEESFRNVTLDETVRNLSDSIITAEGSAPYRGNGGVNLGNGPAYQAALSRLAATGILDPRKLFGSCGASLRELIDQYNVDVLDLGKLTRSEFMAKYHIPEGRMSAFEQVCGPFEGLTGK